MNALEWRATGALSLVYALRMLGMFMILPVLAIYAKQLDAGVAGWQIGLAFGAYGLMQAVLQLPLGILSDRIGRKPVIAFGLLIFAAGGVVAGMSHTIEGVILGRAVQGCGAVSAAVSALLADTTRPQVRTTAMAVLGAGMGLSFVLALVLGPIFSGTIGVPGIFYTTSVLAVVAVPMVLLGVPAAPLKVGDTKGGMLRAVTAAPLLRLNGGIFMLHAMMTCLFMVAPLAIEKTLNLPEPQHWKVYLPLLILSVIPVFPAVRKVEQKGLVRDGMFGAVILLGIALLISGSGYSNTDLLLVGLFVFFVAFNFLEGVLPSQISKLAPIDQKGAALGVYSTCQFLGGFAGSSVGGQALTHWGVPGVFIAASVLALIWLSFVRGSRDAREASAPPDAVHQK